MGKKTRAKNIAIFSAMITLISFIYKCSLGVITNSLVLIIASISTFMVFICKVAFAKNVASTRDNKKRAYLVMTVSCLIYSLIFILFVVLKIFGIDTSNKKTYEGFLGAIFIGFILIMFILSLIGLKGALEKHDVMFIGLKEITFISALTDLVIIMEFITRIVLKYKVDIPYLEKINNYVPLGIGITMVIIIIFMFIRYATYKVKASNE